MSIYYAVVHKDPDSAYGISFPDLPGCFSAADEAGDVLPNAIQAVEFYLEDATDGRAPRSFEDVKREVSEELAEGAFLLAVPYVRILSRVVKANISLDRGILDAIDEAASLRSMTRSAFMVEAARNEIGGRF